MRQTSAGNVAGIVIRYENGSVFLQLCNPFSTSLAWQWVSMEKQMERIFDLSLFQIASSRMTVELTHCVSDDGEVFNGSAIIYFDDLHVSYKQGTYIISGYRV